MEWNEEVVEGSIGEEMIGSKHFKSFDNHTNPIFLLQVGHNIILLIYKCKNH